MNKKSSPDDAENPEFHAVFFTPEGKTSTLQGSYNPASQGFDMQGEIWEAMLVDPSLRTRLDEWVEKKSSEKIEAALKELGTSVEEQARKTGFELGRTQAVAEAVENEDRLKIICEELISQTSQILHNHEKIWIEALHRVLHSFLVDAPKASAEMIEKWVEGQRQEFFRQGKVVIYVSPEDFGGSLPFSEAGKWEWRLDTSLKAREIRAEAEGSGIFFSPDQQWKRLEEMMDRAIRGTQ